MDDFKKIYTPLVDAMLSVSGIGAGLAIIIPIIGALIIAYLARSIPTRNLKLEQLKYIDSLIIAKAWKDKSRIFTIEQIFEQYFNKKIGFREIVYICKMRNPSGAFRIYLRAAPYIKYDDESKEFIVEDRKFTVLKSILASLISYGSFFMALFLAALSSPVSDIYISNTYDSLLFAYWFIVVTSITSLLYVALFTLNEVFVRREIIGKFKLAFEGHLRQKKISSTDLFILLICIFYSLIPTLFVIYAGK